MRRLASPDAGGLDGRRPVPKDADCPSAIIATRNHIAAACLNHEQSLEFLVEQARHLTSAAGAAIALREGGDVVCCARSGSIAPDMGARLDQQSGISSECLRSRQVQLCNDTETDARVDTQLCRNMGMRSILAVPVRNQQGVLGILAVFSGWAGAFSERDIHTLELLADLAVETQASKQVRQRPGPLEEPVQGNTPVSKPISADGEASAVAVRKGGASRLGWRVPRTVAILLAMLAAGSEGVLWHGAHIRRIVRLGNAALAPHAMPATPTKIPPVSLPVREARPAEAVVPPAPETRLSPVPEASQVLSIRYWSKPEGTTVAVLLTAPPQWQSGVLTGPERIYFDLDHTRLPAGIPNRSALQVNDQLIRRIRAYRKPPDAVRIVFDLAAAHTRHSAVLLPTDPYQLMIEVRGTLVAKDAPAEASLPVSKKLPIHDTQGEWTIAQPDPVKAQAAFLPLSKDAGRQDTGQGKLLTGPGGVLELTEVLPPSHGIDARNAPLVAAGTPPGWPSGLTLSICDRPSWEVDPIETDASSFLLAAMDDDHRQTSAKRSLDLQSPWSAIDQVCGFSSVVELTSPAGKSHKATVSVISLRVPKNARKAYEKAQHAVRKQNLAEAQTELQRAVRLYPQFAAAWTELGWLHAQQNRLDQAGEAFVQARSADARFVPAYLGLAWLALVQFRWRDAVELSERATRLDGAEYPVAFYYNSLGNFQLGRLYNAEDSARNAERLGLQHALPQVNLLLGVILAQKQDYGGGADEFRSYLKAAPQAANADKVRHQLAELEKLTGLKSKTSEAPPRSR